MYDRVVQTFKNGYFNLELTGPGMGLLNMPNWQNRSVPTISRGGYDTTYETYAWRAHLKNDNTLTITQVGPMGYEQSTTVMLSPRLANEMWLLLTSRTEDIEMNGGKRSKRSKRSKRWVSKAVGSLKRTGSLTRKAKRSKMSTQAFACKVLRSPKNFTLQTRRQAQFYRNINKSHRC